MAKKGMARPERTHSHARNQVPPVPQIQGKARHGKEQVKPVIAGTEGPDLKVYHTQNHRNDDQQSQKG